jgi:hypothetical protein
MASVTPTVDGTINLIARIYQRALLDAQQGDKSATEFLDLTAPDWRQRWQLEQDVHQPSKLGEYQLMATITVSMLESERRHVERLAQQVQQQKAGLYRSDGTKFYGEREHAERVQAALQPLQQAVSEARTKADQAHTTARMLALGSNADPFLSLSNDELQRAAALLPLVQFEVAGMGVKELTARLYAVAEGKDKVAKLIYARVAGPRIDKVSQDALTMQESELMRDLRSLMAQLETTAAEPQVAKMTEEAMKLRKTANELLVFVNDVLGEADGSKAAYIERKRAEYGAM